MEDHLLISATIITHNEAKNIARAVASLDGVNEIVVVDDHSTDDTIEVAKGLGVEVYSRRTKNDTPTKDQINDFVVKFGWQPKFNLESSLRDIGKQKNEAADLATHDWIISLDADEEVEWDLPRLRKHLNDCDTIECVHKTGESYHQTHRMYNKKKVKFHNRIHEVISGGERFLKADDMIIHHHQEHRAYRSDYLPGLEYSVVIDSNQRALFYLAREYYYHKEYEKAIEVYNRYLKEAWWKPEIAESYLSIARCLWWLYRGDEARENCLKAIQVNPDYKEALNQMADMCWENEAQVWRKYAKAATNQGVLIIKGD